MFGSRSAGLDPMRTVGLQDLQARQQQELARMQEEHKRQLLEAEGATKRQKRGKSKQAPPLMPEPEPLPLTPTVVYRTPLPLPVPLPAPTPSSSPAPLQSSSRSSRSARASKPKAKQKKRITSEEEEDSEGTGTGTGDEEEEEEVPKEVGEVSMGVSKKNGGKPRQPLNAFMLFRMQEAPLLKKENPKLTLAETNQRISAAWNELQDHVRDTYLRKAKEGQLEYAKAKLAYGRQLYCCAGLAAAFPEGGKYKAEAKARKSEELGIEWSQKSTEDQEKWIKNHKRREKKNKQMAL